MVLRDRLKAALLKEIPDAVVHGPAQNRLSNNLNLSIPGIDSASLMRLIPNIALSSGSACTSMSLEPSYVLKAIGVPDKLRHSSLRFGLGRFNTAAEIETASQAIIRAVRKLKK